MSTYTPKSRQDLLDVLVRTMDSGWLDPLQSDADSSAVLNAIADTLAAASSMFVQAIENTTISDASGGTPGTSIVTMTRATTGIGGVIPAGYKLLDSRGLAASTMTALTVSSSAATINLVVQTTRLTELANTTADPGYTLDPTNLGVVDTGGTNALISPAGPPSGLPPIVATSFVTVASSTPITGALSDWLTAVARERGVLRQPNESDGSYRARIRNVPDMVSPIAVAQGVQGAAQHAGLPPIDVIEPFNDGATLSLKENYNLTSFGGTFTNADYCDDQTLEINSLRTFRRYIRLQPEALPNNPDGSGLYCNDGFCDDYVFGFLDTGYNAQLFQGLLAVLEEANRKRAAGVYVEEYLESPLQLTRLDNTTNSSLTLMWAASAPTGQGWIFQDAVYTHDFALSPQPPTGTVSGAFHRIVFTFSDSSTWTAPDWFFNYCQHLTLEQAMALGFPANKLVTQIAGYAETDGTHPINLVGTTYVYATSL